VGLFDRLPLLARSIGTVVLPTADAATSGLVGWVESWGVPILSKGANFIEDNIASYFLPFREVHFHAIITIGVLFLAILLLNRVFTRFWCRGICPLGALLGIFSRFAIFGLEKDEESCDHCKLCRLHCQGGDNPDPGTTWHQAECHVCLNCQATCPHGSIRFKFFPNLDTTPPKKAGTQKIDASRRKILASLAGGLLVLPLFRSGDAFEANSSPKLIRPPGATPEDEFLGRCIRCGQCMRVCPNNALHPTLLEGGWEGLWTPIMIARIGYCEPSCTLCTQVCPTGALIELSLEEKVGDEDTPPNRLGTAFLDRGRCLPWAMGTACIVCEEWCPTSPKSIYLREEKFLNRKGEEVVLKRPYVDPEVCTGCGACEYACPVNDKAAIRVSSVGESRSRENQILLRRNRSLPADRYKGGTDSS
jgi:MauM/NapG family ferredoxin protein